jgi:hypothetical protein
MGFCICALAITIVNLLCSLGEQDKSNPLLWLVEVFYFLRYYLCALWIVIDIFHYVLFPLFIMSCARSSQRAFTIMLTSCKVISFFFSLNEFALIEKKPKEK